LSGAAWNPSATLQAFGAPFMFVMAAALLIWVRVKAGSFGSMLSTPSQFHSTGEFLAVFFPSLTAMVGYWATLALNIPDFTRYSKSQTCAGMGSGVWLACRHDALHVCRHLGHLGVISALSASRSGIRSS
jgi:cytosine/uracil/thiamine/allantoin permease